MEKQRAMELTVLTEAIIPQIENWLTSSEGIYLVDDKMTVADLVVYHELEQLLLVSGKNVDEEKFPAITTWRAELGRLKEGKLTKLV